MKLVCILRSILFVCVTFIIFASCSDDIITYSRRGIEDGPATLSNRIDRNNEFAFKLYAELKASDDNLIISPHSIATCFGMAYAGARGDTEKQIADILCFNYPQQGFHAILETLNEDLTSRADIDLRIANGSWGQDGSHYEQAYLDTLSECYGAAIEYLDFAGDPEGSRDTINNWVKDNTAGYIDELLPSDCLDGNTYLVLANTVYFMAEWLHQFKPEYTYPGSFTRLDDSQVTAQLMHGEQKMPYFVGDGFAAMAMPYKGEQVSMVLILPDEGQYSAFEDAFSAAGFDTVVANLVETYITFTIPKFGFYSYFDLGESLYDMGIVDAFTPGVADFSGMDGTAEDGMPWIDLVVHKAYIMIDEYGTMAFAGTAMELSLGIHPSFDALRPFIYVIVDNPTGTILFMGRVLDPTAE